MGLLATGVATFASAQSSLGTEDESAQRLPAQKVEATALNLRLTTGNTSLSRGALVPWGERNAAAALARIPGVTLESKNGDARYVIIRGIDPTYNAVTINGASLATGSPEDRATQLDGFELEGFEQIELTKVLRPDQPANAVGGLINFSSPSAFDYASGHTEIGADFIADAESGDLGTGAYLRYGKTWDDDTIGLFLTGSTRARSWQNRATETDPFVATAGGFLPQNEINFDRLDVERERTGGSLNWEKKSPGKGRWFLRGSETMFDDMNWRQRSQFEFEDARNSASLSTRSGAIRFQDNPATTLDDIGISQQLRRRKTRSELSLWGIGGELTQRHWTWDIALNRAAGGEVEETTELAYELLTPPSMLALSAPANRSITVISNPSNSAIAAGDFGLDDVTTEIFDSRETNWNGHLNLTREFDEQNVMKRIRFGAHFQFKRKRSEVEVTEYFAGPTSFDSLNATSSTTTSGSFLPTIPRSRLAEFETHRSQFSQIREIGESVAGDYHSDEDILAAFAMAEWEWNTTTLTAGARWEQSDFWSESKSFDAATNAITPVTGGTRIDHLLPGIHLQYRSPDTIHSTDAWSLRAAYTQTLGRPGFEESKAGVFIEDDEIEMGNPALKPLHSQNLDLSISYERPVWGRSEATVFHKNIGDFIYSNRRQFDFDGDGEVDEVTEFVNGRSGHISGVELSYQHTLWGKPHADRRLDLITSTTFIDSGATYFDATLPQPERNLPFIKQSDQISRVDLEWYHRAWMARISYHYRSGYLDEIGEGTDDFEVEGYGQLDLSIGYQPNLAWSAYLRLENVTAEPFRARWASSKRIAESEELNPTVSFGLTWKH